MSTATKPAPAAKTNGVETKTETVKKSFKEMTEKEKVAAVVKSAIGFSKSNGYKGVDFKITNEEGVEVAPTTEGYAARFEKLFKIKMYPVYRAEENKIALLQDAEYTELKTKAVASLGEQKTKKYGKATQDLINFCLKLKGQAKSRAWDAESVADWTL